jgi:hypothetical protein
MSLAGSGSFLRTALAVFGPAGFTRLETGEASRWLYLFRHWLITKKPVGIVS